MQRGGVYFTSWSFQRLFSCVVARQRKNQYIGGGGGSFYQNTDLTRIINGIPNSLTLLVLGAGSNHLTADS